MSAGSYAWRSPTEGGSGERTATTAPREPERRLRLAPVERTGDVDLHLPRGEHQARLPVRECHLLGERTFDRLPATIEVGANGSAECTVKNVRQPGVNLCHATDNPDNPYEPVYMYLEDGQLKPVRPPGSHGRHHSLVHVSGSSRSRDGTGGARQRRSCSRPAAWCRRSSREVTPTVRCVERFGDDKLRAHFGYVNSGLLPPTLAPGAPWNSFSPEPADRGQGARLRAGRRTPTPSRSSSSRA